MLLYISEDSGHHSASRAIEEALHSIDPSIATTNINSFNYTNPILERVINRAYMGVVKRTPEIWDYLYDNPKVVKSTQKLREMIHRFNTGKLKILLDDYKPDAIVCTQAFPCGMIADYKKSFSVDIPLIGVLTDYAPHSYWVYNNVDRYIVPSEEVGKKLIDDGIEPARVLPTGIPIHQKFSIAQDRRRLLDMYALRGDKPVILVMGGSQGLGPIRELMLLLDRSFIDAQAVVVVGTNKKLYRWLTRRWRRFRKTIVALAYADNIEALMDMSTLIVTKPGGITTAEALAKRLPLVILNPLPGQEAMNTKYLLKEGVAVKAEGPDDTVVLLEELLYNTPKLTLMRERAARLSRPSSSMDIARLVIELIDTQRSATKA